MRDCFGQIDIQFDLTTTHQVSAHAISESQLFYQCTTDERRIRACARGGVQQSVMFKAGRQPTSEDSRRGAENEQTRRETWQIRNGT